jgi:hypothetical protein
MHAKITDGQITQYPYSPGQLRRDNPQVSFPKDISDELLAEYGVLPVAPSQRPAHDPLHEQVSDAAAFVDGALTQVWTVTRRPEIPTVEAVLAEAIARIKTRCGEVIEAAYPMWRQMNMQARAIQLLDIRRVRELTEAEAAERDSLEAAYAWLVRQRMESNRLEAVASAIAGGPDADDAKRRAITAIHFEEVP